MKKINWSHRLMPSILIQLNQIFPSPHTASLFILPILLCWVDLLPMVVDLSTLPFGVDVLPVVLDLSISPNVRYLLFCLLNFFLYNLVMGGLTILPKECHLVPKVKGGKLFLYDIKLFPSSLPCREILPLN